MGSTGTFFTPSVGVSKGVPILGASGVADGGVVGSAPTMCKPELRVGQKAAQLGLALAGFITQDHRPNSATLCLSILKCMVSSSDSLKKGPLDGSK